MLVVWAALLFGAEGTTVFPPGYWNLSSASSLDVDPDYEDYGNLTFGWGNGSVSWLTTEGPPKAEVWPVRLAAEVAGDVVLGGLMMVHEREDTRICGPIMPQGGIQAVEAMLYTLDRINDRGKTFTIGAHILDDCDKDTYGLEMAVEFIKGNTFLFKK